ncbi:anthranilate synthase component ii [Trichoderma arundinaceum]|uniref:Anthranilate synthase component ii n=1 Tax=Trichoderma arundinaceum TaxID=490622 RepID=A0A395NIT9_TRIAR|nr:anthranilate synthase component ii [Trichoderma arundinaceum]
MPRRIFKNLVIATAGPLPGQLTVDNLRQWTSIRKGVFTEDFDDQVTHLLFKEALARGKRQHIVHCDWFEISAVNEKKEPERDYSMRNILAKQNAAKREQAQIERGKREGERAVNTNFFHIYNDRTFFPYQIDITRDDDETGELGQRYTLYLWESNAKPHLYWFTAKFMKKKGDSQPSFHRPSPCSGPWRQEMDLFMDFFRIKTGIEWQDRVIKQNIMPGSFFQYTPPTGGKPIGRRLRFCYEYCLEVNAQLRGLPWPPVEGTVEAKEEDIVTRPQSPIFDDTDHEVVTHDEVLIKSDSELPSETVIGDIDREGNSPGEEGETDEQATSQESEPEAEIIDSDTPMASQERSAAAQNLSFGNTNTNNISETIKPYTQAYNIILPHHPFPSVILLRDPIRPCAASMPSSDFSMLAPAALSKFLSSSRVAEKLLELSFSALAILRIESEMASCSTRC